MLTLKRKMSFLSRIDRISKNIQEFSSGQKYIEESDWKQLRNIEDIVDSGFAFLGKPSVHNLVQVDYLEKVRSKLVCAEVAL